VATGQYLAAALVRRKTTMTRAVAVLDVAATAAAYLPISELLL
jgi:hypothetical protein